MKGTQVGSYIIENKIGEGGMGVVYVAKHARMNRQAVVKVLHRHLAESPDMAKRFENEANAAASIGHPGIVQVFDIGQQDDGSLYIIMERLAGESLQDRLERLGKLPMAQAIAVISQCADALAAAHAAGIVHRDLKPDNVFLVPDSLVPGGERAKLLDFGIAKLQVEGMATMGTKMGTLMGTPPYMSPEQCQGAGGVDHLSDLYSLGCMLFQLVTGRTPFVGKGAGDYIVAHRTEAPPSLRSLVPDAPQELEEITSNLLAKTPADRFASASALVAALGAVKLGEPGAQPQVPTHGPDHTAPVVAATPLSHAGRAAGKEPDTTLGLSAGQSPEQSVAPTQHSGSKGKVAVFGLLAVMAAGILGVVVLGGESKPSNSAATTTPTPAPGPEPVVHPKGVGEAEVEPIRLTLKLDPPGAQVLVAGQTVATADDGSVDIEVARNKDVAIEVRSPGYESFTQTVNYSSDEVLAVVLKNPARQAELLRAKTRQDAWLNASIRTRLAILGDSISGRGKFKSADGKSKITVKLDGVFVACGIDFGDDGNPSRVRDCTAKGEVFRIKPTPLSCSPKGKKSLVCAAKSVPTRVEKKSVRMSFQIGRPLIDADTPAD